MELHFTIAAPGKTRTDVLVMFAHKDPRQIRKVQSELRTIAGDAFQRIVVAGDFTGNDKELALVHTRKNHPSKRLLVVGLGERRSVNLERLRRAAAAAAKEARRLKAKDVTFVLPETRESAEETSIALYEGALLSLYRFEKYKQAKNGAESPVTNIHIVSPLPGDRSAGERARDHASHVLAGTVLARDLANGPGNEIYPETLALAAQECGARNGFSVTVRDEHDIAELGMGGVLAVARGSDRKPRFIIMEFGPKSKPPVVLVGKGVTFDTGGISIKPSVGMAEMKMDMSGAAAVIGTFEAVSRLKLPVHIVGLIPAVENMPGSKAMRPGDIVRHYNGKTSEVDNTDAEGRLILADALAYAAEFKPAAVIDLATLTGAVVVALGHVATGMMGNDRELMNRLTKAGEKTFERVWELPLFDEYERLIRSDVADVKNVGGRWAGPITAGWFLKKHIGEYRWVHLDIAGTAILEENGDYTQRGSSGVGVRLLTEFLRRWK